MIITNVIGKNITRQEHGQANILKMDKYPICTSNDGQKNLILPFTYLCLYFIIVSEWQKTFWLGFKRKDLEIGLNKPDDISDLDVTPEHKHEPS